eukprot:1332051-Amphidinium_carterae.1
MTFRIITICGIVSVLQVSSSRLYSSESSESASEREVDAEVEPDPSIPEAQHRQGRTARLLERT